MMKHIAAAILNALVLRKVIALFLIVVLIMTLVFPRPVKAQLFLIKLINLLNTVYEIIKNDLGKVLDQIAILKQWFDDFYQLFLLHARPDHLQKSEDD